MRATIKNYLDAAKQRREKTGQSGFSLIELIVVVAILGVLVAVAIPVFGSIQTSAEQNAVSAVAANSATAAAAAVADTDAATTPASVAEKMSKDGYTVTVVGTITNVDTVCMKAAKGTGESATPWAQAGPGCTGKANSWAP